MIVMIPLSLRGRVHNYKLVDVSYSARGFIELQCHLFIRIFQQALLKMFACQTSSSSGFSVSCTIIDIPLTFRIGTHLKDGTLLVESILTYTETSSYH